jgi:hypothetical protein
MMSRNANSKPAPCYHGRRDEVSTGDRNDRVPMLYTTLDRVTRPRRYRSR